MKILNIISVVILSLSLGACSKDFNLTPPDFISDEIFFANPANFEAGLNGVYDAAQSNGIYGRLPILLDGISDNAVAHFVTVSDIENFGNGSLTAEVSNIVRDAYQAPYVMIQRANSLIVNMEKTGKGSLSTEKFNNIRAEARALRAIAYQRLLYMFGAVPLYTHSIGIDESIEIKRISREELVSFILMELSEAATDLQGVPLDNVAGRFTNAAALGFYAQTLLYEARLGKADWSEVLAATNNALNSANTAGNKLVTSGDGSDGLANYNAVFSENNEQNKELVFYIRYDYNVDNGPNIQSNFSIVAGQLFMSVHTNFVNDFYTKDGLPITDPSSIFDPGAPYENRDPRLTANIVVPGAQYSNGQSMMSFSGQTTNSNLRTSFAIRKFTTLNNAIPLNRGGLDIPVLRYVELLLMFAEAENQVNGPTDAAHTALNTVRERVKMPSVIPGLSKTEFNNEVIHERRVELAFEGKRWFDLVTLGIAGEKINAIDEVNRKFVVNKQELFPIPQSEINLNENLLPNNPGY